MYRFKNQNSKIVNNGWRWYIFEQVLIDRDHGVLFLRDSFYSIHKTLYNSPRLGCILTKSMHCEPFIWSKYSRWFDVTTFSHSINSLLLVFCFFFFLLYVKWHGILGIRATKNRFTVMIVLMPLKYKLASEGLFWVAGVHTKSIFFYKYVIIDNL